MIRIGELFEEMGFVRLAINTYVEVLYMSGTSLDDNGGKLWLRVADLELRCGEKKLALRAYLKAAYRSDNARAHAEKGLRTSLGKEQQKDIPPAKFDVEKIKEIANIYGQLNMHPLGLSFLRRAGKTLDVDLSEEEKRLASDWAQILQQIAAVAGNDCSVYGHDISKVDDWATVKILRPSDTFWKPSDKEASNKEANGSQE